MTTPDHDDYEVTRPPVPRMGEAITDPDGTLPPAAPVGATEPPPAPDAAELLEAEAHAFLYETVGDHNGYIVAVLVGDRLIVVNHGDTNQLAAIGVMIAKATRAQQLKAEYKALTGEELN